MLSKTLSDLGFYMFSVSYLALDIDRVACFRYLLIVAILLQFLHMAVFQ